MEGAKGPARGMAVPKGRGASGVLSLQNEITVVRVGLCRQLEIQFRMPVAVRRAGIDEEGLGWLSLA